MFIRTTHILVFAVQASLLLASFSAAFIKPSVSLNPVTNQPSKPTENVKEQMSHQNNLVQIFRDNAPKFVAGAMLSIFVATSSVPDPSYAVSGGGKDYAEQTISGQDFSNKDYSGKDFSGVNAIGTNFRSSTFRGCRFFKGNLRDADFTGADLTGAAMEGAYMEGIVLKNAVVSEAYFSDTLKDVGDVTGADFSDALIGPFELKQLCGRKDLDVENPKTGVTTRDSLGCN